MNYALVGYGRMGRAIEAVAGRRGHRAVAIIDPHANDPRARPAIEGAGLADAEVAFEFTAPAAAPGNVSALLAAGVAVVCGSTGWRAGDVAHAADGPGLVIASNFSVGMNLFYRVVASAARCVTPTGLYERYLVESHHRGKVDAPSGTARVLAGLIRENDPAHPAVEYARAGEGAVQPGAIHVASVRTGHEPGTHVVGFDGEDDTIELTHRARGRGGFALGAVLAAEWVRTRSGRHDFDAVLDDLLRAGAGEDDR